MEISWERFSRNVFGNWFRIVLGDRGSGKTNFALLLAEVLTDAGYAPYLVLPAKALEIEIAGLRVVGFKDRKEWKSFLKSLRKAVVVLDEGLLLANARDRQRGFGTDIAKVSAIARHRELVFILTTQAHRVDIQLRELADYVVVKRTSLGRLLLLDRPPKRILMVDKALRRRSAGIGRPKSLETLEPSEAVAIGWKSYFVYGIPKSRWIDDLSTWASEYEIELRRRSPRKPLGSGSPSSEAEFGFYSRQKGSYVAGIRILYGSQGDPSRLSPPVSGP